MVSEISKSGHFKSLKQQCLIILIFFLVHHDSNQETCMNIAQETVTYLEFQTRKRNGEKEQLTLGTLVTGQLFRIF